MSSYKMLKVRFLVGNVGHEAIMKEPVAKVMADRRQVKILGEVNAEGKPAKEVSDEIIEKLSNLRKNLAEEKAQAEPNANAIRSLENQIAKLIEK